MGWQKCFMPFINYCLEFLSTFRSIDGVSESKEGLSEIRLTVNVYFEFILTAAIVPNLFEDGKELRLIGENPTFEFFYDLVGIVMLGVITLCLGSISAMSHHELSDLFFPVSASGVVDGNPVGESNCFVACSNFGNFD